MEHSTRRSQPQAYDDEILLPIKTVLFEFSRKHGQQFSDGALLLLSMVYAELDRLPRVTILNITNLSIRTGRSASSIRRALVSAEKVGLVKKLDTSNRGVQYRIYDPRVIAVKQEIDPQNPQLRLRFVDVFDDDAEHSLRIAGAIGDEPLDGSGTACVQWGLLDDQSLDGSGTASGESSTNPVDASDAEHRMRPVPLAGSGTACGDSEDGDLQQIYDSKRRNLQRLECGQAGAGSSIGTPIANVNVKENISLNVQRSSPNGCQSRESILGYFHSLRKSLQDPGMLYTWMLLGIALMVTTDQVRIDNQQITLSENDVAGVVSSTNKYGNHGGYFWRSIQAKIREAADWPDATEFKLDFSHIAELADRLQLDFSVQRLKCHVANLRPRHAK